MRRIIAVATVFSICLSKAGFAQEQVSANPTRPSVSDNAYLTAPGYTELEAGGLVTNNLWTIPALLKFSVHRQLEVGFAMVGLLNHVDGGDTEIGDPGLQVKAQLLERPWGALALVGRADWAGNSNPGYTAYSTLSYQASKFQLDATLGGAFFQADALLWAVAVSPKVRSRVGGFAELFGTNSSDGGTTAFDLGFSYGHSSRLVSDVSFTIGLDNNSADWLLQIGLTTVLAKVLE